MTESDLSAKPYGTVLIKAKDILDFLFSRPNAPTLSDISTGLHASKSTTLKILTTMDMLGLVRRDAETKQYYLGTQLIAYAQKALASFDITKIARPFLQDLRDQTGETINLGVIRDEKIVLIEKLESPASIKLQSTIGGTMNLYSSAMGKAALATYSPEHLQTYLAKHQLHPVTPHTITSPSKLIQDLKAIEATGISIDNEENELDVFCIGCTIRKNNRIYGGVSISTPKYRLTKQRQTQFVRLLLNTQHAIEDAL